MQKPEKDGVASIYLACRSLMAGVVRRIVRRHDVEDILQEAFIRSFEAESRQTIHDARAFLLRTARNLALDHVSRAAYRRTGSLDGLDEEHSIDSAAPPDVQVDAERRFLSFCQAVGSLPDQCRRVFVLHKIYGMSHDEISARLEIAPSTIEKHIAKGLLLCHQHMTSRARSGHAVTRHTA
ncbi:MAG TPA: sigma-70 family RNA polymerase sigma factor [Steroidobacteraceae bacterium]|nr:sigma-70 family RNA polymerase sigma factor [Steroidobacteraceae bacterium]HXS30811.1 sigma-70 family RNA polymerase sigma factor [Steroidobacteraceae bacterium]